MTEASVQVDRDADAGVRITLTGEIDMDNAAQVEHRILSAISNQLSTVTVDLGGLDYIDSAGLRVLFTLGTRLENLQIAPKVVVPTESAVRRVIDLAGLSGVMPVSPS
jgi:anti-sigma B factor antagonist